MKRTIKLARPPSLDWRRLSPQDIAIIHRQPACIFAATPRLALGQGVAPRPLGEQPLRPSRKKRWCELLSSKHRVLSGGAFVSRGAEHGSSTTTNWRRARVAHRLEPTSPEAIIWTLATTRLVGGNAVVYICASVYHLRSTQILLIYAYTPPSNVSISCTLPVFSYLRHELLANPIAGASIPLAIDAERPPAHPSESWHCGWPYPTLRRFASRSGLAVPPKSSH